MIGEGTLVLDNTRGFLVKALTSANLNLSLDSQLAPTSILKVGVRYWASDASESGEVLKIE